MLNVIGRLSKILVYSSLGLGSTFEVLSKNFLLKLLNVLGRLSLDTLILLKMLNVMVRLPLDWFGCNNNDLSSKLIPILARQKYVNQH